MLPYTGRHWIAFFKAIRRPDLAATLQVEDERQRNANIRALYSVLAKVTPHRTTAEWMAICERLDIPASPLTSLDDLPDQTQLKSVGLFQAMDHPTEGTLNYVRPTVKFARSPASVRAPAPRLGNHSREILREAGCADSEIDALMERRVVIQHE